MIIYGEKVALRAIEEKDSAMFLELINDPETEKMIGCLSFPVSSIEQEQWIKEQSNNKTNLRCVVVEKANQDKGLGTVILSDIDYRNGVAQIHIKMLKGEGRGKGYGTDAVRAIVGYAFKELRLNCIYAVVLQYNTISQKLFERCGFKKEGLLRERVFKNGEHLDVISYSLLKGDLQ